MNNRISTLTVTQQKRTFLLIAITPLLFFAMPATADDSAIVRCNLGNYQKNGPGELT